MNFANVSIAVWKYWCVLNGAIKNSIKSGKCIDIVLIRIANNNCLKYINQRKTESTWSIPCLSEQAHQVKTISDYIFHEMVFRSYVDNAVGYPYICVCVFCTNLTNINIIAVCWEFRLVLISTIVDSWSIHISITKSDITTYRQVSYIRRTLVGNKIVDHSDVVGTSPVGAAPTTSSFST